MTAQSPIEFMRKKDFSIGPQLSNVLDVLRTIAAFMVVSWHVVSEMFVPSDHPDLPTQIFLTYTDLGGHAVVIFFVVSGFLIGKAAIQVFMLREKSVHGFIVDRITRIYIVLIPALTFGFALDYVLVHALGPEGFDKIAGNMTIAVFLGNLFALQTIFSPIFGSNEPLWSLSFELWYYLMFPLGLAACFGVAKGIRFVSAILLVAALAICSNHLASTMTPHLLKFAPLWMIGVAAWLPSKPLIPRWLGWLLLFAFLSTAHSDLLSVRGVGFAHLLGTAASVALLLSAYRLDPRSHSNRFRKFWKFFSGFSYSVYLYHYPVLIMLTYTLKNAGIGPYSSTTPEGISTWIILLLIFYLYCYIGYLATERHYHTLRRVVYTRFGGQT